MTDFKVTNILDTIHGARSYFYTRPRAEQDMRESTWREHMERTHGKSTWREHMKRTHGESTWREHMTFRQRDLTTVKE